MSLPSDEHGDNEEGMLGRLGILLLIYLAEREPGEEELGLLFPWVYLERDGLWVISLDLLFIPGQEEREASALALSPIPKGEASEVTVLTE